MYMAGIVPTIPLHFLRLDNCSCIVLPSDFRVGRMEVRCTNAAEATDGRERRPTLKQFTASMLKKKPASIASGF